MKILRVINSLQAGGAERSLAGNVPLHNKNGYQTDILLLSDKDSFFLEVLKNENVKIYSLHAKNIYNPLLVFKLIKYFKKYDIVHAHLFPSIYWVALARILSSPKPKLVLTEHNTSNKRRNIKIFKFIDKLIYNQYERIISISEATSSLLDLYINIGKKIVTVPNGIDIINFRKRLNDSKKDILNISNDKKVIVQIASFSHQKDQDTVIKSMLYLTSDYFLVLVGVGERLELCKELAMQLKVDNRVFFLGLRKDIAEIINVSDIVVLSSHYEGFGRAAVEGMAMGKPTIVSNVPGLAEVVKGAGLLFESGNSEQLASYISRLINDRHYYKLISSKCYKRSELFDIRTMVDSYEKVYKSLISQP